MNYSWCAAGVRCVCIRDNWGGLHYGPYCIPVRLPMINEVLTIRLVVPAEATAKSILSLVFWEIDELQSDGPLSAKISWDANCFRPLLEKPVDLSIFQQMLARSPERVP